MQRQETKRNAPSDCCSAQKAASPAASVEDKEKGHIVSNKFKKDAFFAIDNKISLNPILNSFQETVNTYSIDLLLINNFLDSMEMDLRERSYNKEKYNDYIHGSAEVVGLMCLMVFVNGNEQLYYNLHI